MNQNTIAFIGAGNLASSLIGGLVNNGYDPKYIWASNPSPEKLAILQQHLGIHATSSNHEAASKADVLVLSVKPQVLATVAKELATTIAQQKPLVISVAAGIRVATLQTWLQGQAAIVRCMPNTPALVGNGATGLYANTNVSPPQRNQAESLMRAVGITVWLDQEDLLDVVTALSASGPAYFFLVMEALAQAAQAAGLSQETASLLTMQTALGAAHMALEGGASLATLREGVTSPGGTTEKAIHVLEQGHIRELFAQALNAARDRSIELANVLGHTS